MTITITGRITQTGKIKTLPTILVNGDIGIFVGGYGDVAGLNNIDQINISSLGDATVFGELTVDVRMHGATSNGLSDRGVFGGGWGTEDVNAINYITVSSTGNAADFGDLTNARRCEATSNGTNDRGVFFGYFNDNRMDYITISSTGNAVDFGDTIITGHQGASTSNGINERGLRGVGWNPPGSASNIIEYITISSLGDSADFGDLLEEMSTYCATSNGIDERGVYSGGSLLGIDKNLISYVTISSIGNASDFGDLTIDRRDPAATSSGTGDRGVIGGGDSTERVNVIDYITISSLGNAADFGDLTIVTFLADATSDGLS